MTLQPPQGVKACHQFSWSSKQIGPDLHCLTYHVADMQVRQAVKDPEKAKRQQLQMRQLARSMEGKLKLNYVSESVFFEDVAGIGEAKVCDSPRQLSL